MYLWHVHFKCFRFLMTFKLAGKECRINMQDNLNANVSEWKTLPNFS